MKIQFLNYINGVLKAPILNKFIDNINPANGEVFSYIPNSTLEDVELAVDAANAAKNNWALTPAEQKFIILNKIAEELDKLNEEFAMAESQDQGKPIWLARNEVKRAAQNFRFFATAAMQFASEAHVMEQGTVNYTIRKPIGIVGCISPWNLPLYLFSWKIAPALAAGNCVIAKPSEFTPYTAFLLSKVCINAGLPAGVLNIVHGYGNVVGEALVMHPSIKAISFTGGTATGARIATNVAPLFKKVSLELGGKNPNIIFDNCQIEKAVDTTISSSFLNQGEICLCGSRILVQKGIYEKFKTLFIAKVNALIVGPPQNKDSFMGAMVSQVHFNKVMEFINEAKKQNATFLTGGNAIKPIGFENGFYIEPTVLENLGPKSSINQQEIFGPVVCLIPFDTEEEAIEIANDVDYGLACSVWTTNLEQAHRVAAKVESGIVWINCWLLRDLRTPFGGVKQSGVGREGGWEAMRFFTEPKNVCIQVKL